ncbi:MAG: hypothetical protein WA793_14700 [Sphingorhabdus sp.]|uniref:hypothetical protein n=1 Tax=Sphingorhabdus sp. TaxID=1902408 RepID=UPI0032B8BABD
MLGPENAIWDDGEWVSWDEINQQLQYKEWGAKYPNADRSLIPIFEGLLSLAEDYHNATGSHLQVYGDIGELFCAITHGMKLNRNYAPGADGRLGKDHVEVKTITPFKNSDLVEVKAIGNFSKLFVVKINAEFEIAGRLIDRKYLPPAKRGKIRVRWQDLPGLGPAT